MVKVTEQRAIDIQKQSDLKETVESTTTVAVWKIDGEEFVYRKGDDFLKSRTGLNSPWEIWPLDGATKSHAKKRIFKALI